MSLINQDLKVFCDGGSRGNPGPAACAALIKNNQGKILAQKAEFLGETTNNVAEYHGLILGLNLAKRFKPRKLTVYADSKLLINQIQGRYKIKEKNLGPLFIKIWNLKQSFSKINFVYIPREQNKEADSLVRKTLSEVL
jgi:ribonuclease HI